MTQEEFGRYLTKKTTKYFIEGEWLVVSNKNGLLPLFNMTKISDYVRFENNGWVSLDSLVAPNEKIVFENKGMVWLNSKSLNPNKIFKNTKALVINSHQN